jgi:predicted extracellular nuclease
MKLFRITSVLTLLACTTWYTLTTVFAVGAVNLTATETPYTQDFNTLVTTASGTWTNNSTIPGWYHARTGTGATIVANNGGSNAGNLYSYGTGTATDRALGSVGSSNAAVGHLFWGVKFGNSTGQTITSLTVSYTGEQWRNGGAGAAQTAEFSYLITNTFAGSLADFQTVGTVVPQLSFTSPVATGAAAALDGNAASNRVAITSTISGLNLLPGDEIVLRWADPDHAGSDHGLAIDDISITAHSGGVVQPSISVNDVALMEGDGGTTTANFTVTASTSAHSGITFDIATANGTATVADLDYDARQEFVQLIPAGAATYSFAVTVNGDSTLEPNETFAVNLSGVSGATIADAQGIGTITNDDVAPPIVSDVVISQVYGGGGNSEATLRNDFIELFNAGTTAVTLTNWSVQYTGTGGSTWSVTPLTGSIAPGGYYLIQQAAGANLAATPLPAPDAVGTSAMSAGGGKVALMPTTTAIAGACPLSGVVDLVGYGATTCHEGTASTAATSNTTAALRKRGGCYDSDQNGVDFSINEPTPRNSATPARSCTPTTAAIHDIQGSGLESPFAGQDVITTGIVTARKNNGFFLQSAPGGYDANPMTSEALFVFTGATPAVLTGNEVSVRGTAIEYFLLTQIESSLPGDITVISAGGSVPAAITLTPAMLNPAGPASQLEPFEGMRLEAAALVSVAPTDEFGEIATVLPAVQRPVREPGIPLSDPMPSDPTSGTPDCCIPRFDENPERIFIDTEGLVGMSVISVTSNVSIGGVVGPLDFSFGAYKVLPEVAPTVGANMTGVPVPTPAADEFTVAGFNIEFFAGSETQRKKAALAIRQLMKSPDVIGHIEILDEPSLQALADQVNADAIAAGEPNPNYQARLILGPPLGGQPSVQNLGFLVKTSRVRIDSVTQEPAGTYIPPGATDPVVLHDRPPLVLRATADAFGVNPRPVIVVVNHPRSFIDVGLVDPGGDRVRAKRTAQAEDTARLLQELQTDNPGVAVISVGDYNAYQFNDGYTDPIAIIKGTPTPDEQIVVDASPDLVDPNYINLTDSLPIDQQYSFIFEGTPQAIDHVLLNTVAASYVQRYAIARGNSDFPAGGALASDPTRPERSSDHDMPVAFFRFPPPSADLAVTIAADQSTAAAGTPVTYTVTVTNNGISPAQNVAVTANGDTTMFATLAAGATESFQFTAVIGCAVPNAANVTTTATVTSDTADPAGENNTATAGIAVTNAAPTLSAVSASLTQLWPANHKMVDVAINYTAADQCGSVVTAVSVTSSEPVNGIGDGNTSTDWEVVNNHLVRLRAERSGDGPGRIYTVTITATDAAGQTTQSSVAIAVPHSK